MGKGSDQTYGGLLRLAYGKTPGYRMAPKVLTPEEAAERAASADEAAAERARLELVRAIVAGTVHVEGDGAPTDEQVASALAWCANGSEWAGEAKDVLLEELRRRFAALRARVAELETRSFGEL